MAPPPEFEPVPRTTDPATGQPRVNGAQLLPWATDTLETGGTIRDTLIRLQAWVARTYGVPNESGRGE